ncbi:MFS transporter [Pararhizobium haloflavum]|uniref:MFS transporter n=1 Tax=Pararhizobium haloflavum TaxID=2037914 RepID=UPI000C1805B1|nr:MFS transporter [Pararhizobium haloflavum]
MSLPIVPTASFFLVAGVMGTRPLVPLLAIELGIGVAEIGVLVAVFAMIPLLAAAVAGSWMDRHGVVRPLLLGAIVTALGLALPFALGGRVGLYLSQLVAGTGFTLFILAAQKHSGRAAPGLSRERSVAVFSMGVALGSLAGPLLGGPGGDHLGYATTFAILGGVALVAASLVLPLMAGMRPTPLPQNGEPDKSGHNPLRVFGYNKYMARAFLVSSLILIGKDMYVAYFPLYAVQAGMTASWIGIVVAMHNVGGVIMRFFMVSLVIRFGKNLVIITSVIGAGVCYLLLPLTRDPLALAAISIAMGFGLGLGQPLSITRTINLSPPHKVGEVLGIRLACNRLTQFVTPLAIGGASIFAGVSGIFFLIGAVLVAGAARLKVPAEAESAAPLRPDD